MVGNPFIVLLSSVCIYGYHLEWCISTYSLSYFSNDNKNNSIMFKKCLSSRYCSKSLIWLFHLFLSLTHNGNWSTKGLNVLPAVTELGHGRDRIWSPVTGAGGHAGSTISSHPAALSPITCPRVTLGSRQISSLTSDFFSLLTGKMRIIVIPPL